MLYLLIWLSFFKLPSPPSLGLDRSWQMVLTYAAGHGLQHGHDIIFTYGPLGHLMAHAYTGYAFWSFMIWQAGSNVLIAAGVWLFGRRLTGWRQAVYYLYLFWFGSMYVDAMQMAFIAIFGLFLTMPDYRRPGPVALITAGLALLSLIKFTHLMLCGAEVALLAAYYLSIRERRLAALVTGVFVAGFLTGWLLCGQAPGHLPAYLRYGLEVSLGYGGAMGVYGEPRILALGLVSGVGILSYLLCHFLSSTDRRLAGVVSLILTATLFINWKHGFIRADGHVLGHFLTVLLVVCTYPALTQDNLRWLRAKNLLLGVSAAACLWGMAPFIANSLWQSPSNWNYRVRDTVVALADLPRYQRQLEAALETTAAKAAKPTLRAYVGRETVDHLGADQAFTLLNGFNYTPSPTVQAYTAYTPALNRLDEAFYRSDRAPRFVIQRYGSIDERLIALDDSLTQKLIYQNYDYTTEEGGLILWERPQKIVPADPAEEKTVLSRTVRFGEEVAVPDTGSLPVWAVVDVAQNLAGRVRQFLYKPPSLWIQLEDDQGVRHRLTFVRAMGAAGFILQPFFPDSAELIAYQNGRPPRKIRRFSLHTMPGGEAWFADDVRIELRTIRSFKRAADGLQPSAPHRFRMMNRVPVSLHAAAPVIDILIDGRHQLLMNPPSGMEFAAPQPIHRLRADFGIMPDAYERTDGVQFIVEWRDAQGHTERLSTRFLDPKNRTSDRGRQTLEVDLGGRHDGRLLLRTEPGPSGNPAYCWSYWTGIDLQ